MQILIDFEVCNCPSCGCQFAMTADLVRRRRADGASFYCPLGHTMGFGPTEADKLKKLLANATERTRHAEAESKRMRDAEAARKAKRRKPAKKG